VQRYKSRVGKLENSLHIMTVTKFAEQEFLYFSDQSQWTHCYHSSTAISRFTTKICCVALFV